MICIVTKVTKARIENLLTYPSHHGIFIKLWSLAFCHVIYTTSSKRPVDGGELVTAGLDKSPVRRSGTVADFLARQVTF